jgi:hypothetical protein
VGLFGYVHYVTERILLAAVIVSGESWGMATFLSLDSGQVLSVDGL